MTDFPAKHHGRLAGRAERAVEAVTQLRTDYDQAIKDA